MRHERYSVRMRTDVQSVTQHDHERVGFDEIDSNQRLQTLRKHDTTSGLSSRRSLVRHAAHVQARHTRMCRVLSAEFCAHGLSKTVR